MFRAVNILYMVAKNIMIIFIYLKPKPIKPATMKHLFFLLFFALTFTASGQTIKTFNYVVNGKVKARTTTITVKDSIVYINKKKRRLNGKIYTVTNRAGQLVGLCAGRRYYSTSILKRSK